MNMKQKIFAIGMSAVMALSAFCVQAQERERDIKIMIGAEELICEEAPFIENDRVLVPMRAIFEALDATVGWDAATSTVSAVRGESFLVLQIGNKTLFLDEKTVELDVVPVIVDSRTYVPLRAVSEALNMDVLWKAETRTVEINEKA